MLLNVFQYFKYQCPLFRSKSQEDKEEGTAGKAKKKKKKEKKIKLKGLKGKNAEKVKAILEIIQKQKKKTKKKGKKVKKEKAPKEPTVTPKKGEKEEEKEEEKVEEKVEEKAESEPVARETVEAGVEDAPQPEVAPPLSKAGISKLFALAGYASKGEPEDRKSIKPSGIEKSPRKPKKSEAAISPPKLSKFPDLALPEDKSPARRVEDKLSISPGSETKTEPRELSRSTLDDTSSPLHHDDRATPVKDELTRSRFERGPRTPSPKLPKMRDSRSPTKVPIMRDQRSPLHSAKMYDVDGRSPLRSSSPYRDQAEPRPLSGDRSRDRADSRYSEELTRYDREKLDYPSQPDGWHSRRMDRSTSSSERLMKLGKNEYPYSPDRARRDPSPRGYEDRRQRSPSPRRLEPVPSYSDPAFSPRRTDTLSVRSPRGYHVSPRSAVRTPIHYDRSPGYRAHSPAARSPRRRTPPPYDADFVNGSSSRPLSPYRSDDRLLRDKIVSPRRSPGRAAPRDLYHDKDGYSRDLPRRSYSPGRRSPPRSLDRLPRSPDRRIRTPPRDYGRISPSYDRGRPYSPRGRYSPTGRIGSLERRDGRPLSPGRLSPRRYSPRRYSSGRSPLGRSPGGRSPRRYSPGRSPRRRYSPSPRRRSPGRGSLGRSPGRGSLGRSPGRRVDSPRRDYDNRGSSPRRGRYSPRGLSPRRHPRSRSPRGPGGPRLYSPGRRTPSPGRSPYRRPLTPRGPYSPDRFRPPSPLREVRPDSTIPDVELKHPPRPFNPSLKVPRFFI